MRSSLGSVALVSFSVVFGGMSLACSSGGSSFSDGGASSGPDGTLSLGDGGGGSTYHDGQTLGSGPGSGGPDAAYGADAFFATDPPAMYCGVDGGAPPTPGGTPECPSDKNRQGCPCPTAGATAACWPGLRVDRGLGDCKDGTTSCITIDEGLNNVWGPCVGYVLPVPGATGAAACDCFSSGEWAIANLQPCLLTYGDNSVYGFAASPATTDGGMPTCPLPASDTPPPPAPPIWSDDTLKVDCAGTFNLCYTIKAGSASNPQASDCVVGTSCVSATYATANTVQAFPPLPGWADMTSAQAACAAQFNASGGYGQMTVQGKSEYCEGIGADDGGAPMVFSTVGYCSAACNMDPSGAGCANCQSGGSGTFGN